MEGVRCGVDRGPGGGAIRGGAATCVSRGGHHLSTHCPLPPEPGAGFDRLWSRETSDDLRPMLKLKSQFIGKLERR